MYKTGDLILVAGFSSLKIRRWTEWYSTAVLSYNIWEVRRIDDVDINSILRFYDTKQTDTL